MDFSLDGLELDLTTDKSGTRPTQWAKVMKGKKLMAAGREFATKHVAARSSISAVQRKRHGTLPPVSLAQVSFGKSQP